MTAALVGFLGVVVGLAVGFGYRFWSTRREELMAATIAATLLRDALRAVQQTSDAARLVTLWNEQRVALIRLITPADYEVISRGIEAAPQSNSPLIEVFGRLTMLFWSEHQAFILTPLFKYIRRDCLSENVSAIVHELSEQADAVL